MNATATADEFAKITGRQKRLKFKSSKDVTLDPRVIEG